MSITLPAPAKLNLFLHIVGRRADGYHLLQTVFQLLDYGDELHFALRDDGCIRLQGDMADTAPEKNLIVQAAQRLQKTSGSTQGADIRLSKRLPLGGGLGGGSSDAATTLLALNVLWGLGLSIDTLAQLGLALGADVPVFVRGCSSWAEGVGEILQPIELPQRWFVVLTPACHADTAALYAMPELTRNTPIITIAAFLQGGGQISASNSDHNDFQPVAEARYPAIKNALTWLGQHGTSRMTGSGASVFAAFETCEQAHQVLAAKPPDFAGFVAQGLNVSPVHRRLREHKL